MTRFKALCVFALALLAGCGSTTTTKVVNRMVPPEQELADLARARDLGAITPDEYDRLRLKALGGK